MLIKNGKNKSTKETYQTWDQKPGARRGQGTWQLRA